MSHHGKGREDETDDSPFFALPTGIAELDDNEGSLCSGCIEEEEDFESGEAFGLSSGEEGQDYASLFTPPAKKYAALRNQNDETQSFWSFVSSTTEDDAARYNSAESLFSKDFLPFHLRGKTSASTGDIPYFSPQQPTSPRIEALPLLGTSPELKPFTRDKGPPSPSFVPGSPPPVEDQRRFGTRGIFPRSYAPERGPSWQFPQQLINGNAEAKHHEIPLSPARHSQPAGVLPRTRQPSTVPHQLLSPPYSGHINGYPNHFSRGRPRSQSTPNNDSGQPSKHAQRKGTYHNQQYGKTFAAAAALQEHHHQHQQHQQHPHALPLSRGVPLTYGHAYIAPALPALIRQPGGTWQGQGLHAQHHNGLNGPSVAILPKGNKPIPNQRHPPAGRATPAVPPTQQKPKSCRDKLLDGQDAGSVIPPPPAQKRKVKGTWKVKNKSEESKADSSPTSPKLAISDGGVTILTHANAAQLLGNDERTIERADVGTVSDTSQLKAEENTAHEECNEQPRVQGTHNANEQVEQSVDYLILARNDKEAATSLQLAVAEKPAGLKEVDIEQLPADGTAGAPKEVTVQERNTPNSSAALPEDAAATPTLPESALLPAPSVLEEESHAKKATGQRKKKTTTKVKRRRKVSRKKTQEPKLVDIVTSGNTGQEETEPGVPTFPRSDTRVAQDGTAPSSQRNRKTRGDQALCKEEKRGSGLSLGGKPHVVGEQMQLITAWLLYGLMILVSLCESGFTLLARLHKHAYMGVLTHYNVAMSVSYIYAFPYIASLSSVTEWAPAVLWYIFLGWFLFSKGASTVSNGVAGLLTVRVLLPLLFLLEAVRNTAFVLRWNGAERLVLAFVLLSVKEGHFFRKRCLGSLVVFLVLSYCVDQSVPSVSCCLVQWTILIVGLSNHFQCSADLSSPLWPKRKHLSLARLLARSHVAAKIKANSGGCTVRGQMGGGKE